MYTSGEAKKIKNFIGYPIGTGKSNKTIIIATLVQRGSAESLGRLDGNITAYMAIKRYCT